MKDLQSETNIMVNQIGRNSQHYLMTIQYVNIKREKINSIHLLFVFYFLNETFELLTSIIFGRRKTLYSNFMRFFIFIT